MDQLHHLIEGKLQVITVRVSLCGSRGVHPSDDRDFDDYRYRVGDTSHFSTMYTPIIMHLSCG